MKILELRFKNLNSLYGEWTIDFTDPAYVSNGIFALIGPTGAGKSTILDAICLALYGATPRLGKITKSGNEIMSRQTGECYAEVLFASQAGRFRCHWEQRRARKSPDGNLQDQEHQIVDAITHKPIETKKSLVAGVIEEKTGMDFDRFTRSILLAQGGFDTFLQANVEQKSRILEQITGTEIYSEISRRVHERQRDERESLKRLQDSIAGITILDAEEEKRITEEYQIKQEEEDKLDLALVKTQEAIRWLEGIGDLKQEIHTIHEAQKQLQCDMYAFQPEKDRLEKAKQAAMLEGPYATLTSLRTQQQGDIEERDNVEKDLPDWEANLTRQSALLIDAEEQTNKVKKNLQELAPLISNVRMLDQTLADQEKAITKGRNECDAVASAIKEKESLQKEKQRELNGVLDSLALAQTYLNEHGQDAWLVSNLAGIEQQLEQLSTSYRKQIEAKEACQAAETVREETKESLAYSQEQNNIQRKEWLEAKQRKEEKEKTLETWLEGLLLREYRAKRDALLRESMYINTIASLEDHRNALVDGKPCPLCGAKEHPFAKENIPVLLETEQEMDKLEKVIQKAEELEQEIKTLTKALETAEKNQNETRRGLDKALHQKEAAEKDLQEKKKRLETQQTEFDNLKESIARKLKALDIEDISEDQVLLLLETLQSRLDDWQAKTKEKETILNQRDEIRNEINNLEFMIMTEQQAWAKKEEEWKALQKEHQEDKKKRITWFGEKDPDQEENRMQKDVLEAEKKERRIREETASVALKLENAKTKIEVLSKRMEKNKEKLKEEEKTFVHELRTLAFQDESSFLASRMSHEEQEKLAMLAKKLEDTKTELGAKLRDRNERLTAEMAREITDEGIDNLQAQSQVQEEMRAALRDELTGLKSSLSAQEQAKKQMEEKRVLLQAQKKECQRWDKLHGLIGSADGKKYRNFAQGLTFELMVSHANRQLEKMTDRYLLICDEKQPLELNVVDQYQAGEIRSTKNLSGGESFIVSLALALGLSKMSSRKVRVDSLFLDEGFGTLDEEALETALDTLSSLHEDGKLIGIISHVSALKDRISTQIAVRPASAGRSILTGPGCQASKS